MTITAASRLREGWNPGAQEVIARATIGLWVLAPWEANMTLGFKMTSALCVLAAVLVAIVMLPRRSKAQLDDDPMTEPYGDWPSVPP
jgi:hypothetical protein